MNFTDSARSYRLLKIPGCLNNFVRHSRKDGQPAQYAVRRKLVLPDDANFVHCSPQERDSMTRLFGIEWHQHDVISGTQMADNLFKYLRKGVGETTKSTNTAMVDSLVRAFQWKWAHKNECFSQGSDHYCVFFVGGVLNCSRFFQPVLASTQGFHRFAWASVPAMPSVGLSESPLTALSKGLPECPRKFVWKTMARSY